MLPTPFRSHHARLGLLLISCVLICVPLTCTALSSSRFLPLPLWDSLSSGGLNTPRGTRTLQSGAYTASTYLFSMIFNSTTIDSVGFSLQTRMMANDMSSFQMFSLVSDPNVTSVDTSCNQLQVVPDNTSFVYLPVTQVNTSVFATNVNQLLTCDKVNVSLNRLVQSSTNSYRSLDTQVPIHASWGRYEILAFVDSSSAPYLVPSLVAHNMYVACGGLETTIATTSNGYNLSSVNTVDLGTLAFTDNLAAFSSGFQHCTGYVSKVSSNSLFTPTNTAQLYLAYNTPMSQFASSFCEIRDIESFHVELQQSVTLNIDVIKGDGSVYVEAAPFEFTAMDAMQACLGDVDCLGFVSSNISSYETIPFILRRFGSVDSHYQRVGMPYYNGAYLVHWKKLRPFKATMETLSGGSSSTLCGARAMENMTVSVWVQGTRLQCGVFVNDSLVATCSPSTGSDYFLCAVQRITAMDRIYVAPLRLPSASFANGNARLRVFFTTSTASVATVPTLSVDQLVTSASRLLFANPDLTWGSSSKVSSRSIRIRSSAVGSRVKLYMGNVTRLSFAWKQQNFAPASTFAGNIFNITVPGETQPRQCGGAAGFSAGAAALAMNTSTVAGYNGRCDLDLLCPFETINVSITSGFVTIKVVGDGRASFTEYSGWMCVASGGITEYLGTVVAQASLSDVVGNTFPHLQGSSSFSTFVLQTNTVAPTISMLQVTLPMASFVANISGVAYYPFVVDSEFYTGFFTNARLGVFMDHIFDVGRVTTYIPINASVATIYVENANMGSVAVQWSIKGPFNTYTATGSCGSSFGFEDGTSLPSGTCGAFRRCKTIDLRALPLVPEVVGTAAVAVYMLSISVPTSVESNVPCDWAFSAYIDFSDSPLTTTTTTAVLVTSTTAPVTPTTASPLTTSIPNGTSNATTMAPQVPFVEPACEFKCLDGIGCASLFSLCDGANNCNDGSDEANCFDWYAVELNASLTLAESYRSVRGTGGQVVMVVNGTNSTITTRSTDFAVSTDGDCRSVAMANRSMAYAFSESTGTCIVYQHAHNSTALFNFTKNLTFSTTVTDFSVFTILSSPLQYLSCSRRLTCSGNGEAAMLQTNQCGCICDSLYTGSICQSFQNSNADYSSLYVTFKKTASMNATLLQSVLLAYHPSGNFSCDLPMVAGDGLLTFLCRDMKGTLTATQISNVTSVGNLNNALKSVTGFTSDVEMVQQLGTQAIPMFESQNVCAFQQGNSQYLCDLPGAAAVEAIALTLTPLVEVPGASMVVNLTFQKASSSRRLASLRTISVPCPSDFLSAVKASAAAATLTRRCYLDLTQYSLGDNLQTYAVSLVDSVGAPLALTTTGLGAAAASWRRTIFVPDVITPDDPKTQVSDFSIFMWIGIALFLFGGCLFGLVVSLAWIHFKHVKRVLRETKHNNRLTTLVKVVTSLFIRMTRVEEFHSSDEESSDEEDVDDAVANPTASSQSTPRKRIDNRAIPPTQHEENIDKEATAEGAGEDGEEIDDEGNRVIRRNKDVKKFFCLPSWNKRQWSFLTSSWWMTTWIVGIFLVLFFVTSSGVTSDTWLVVERFSDSKCQNSTFASTPQASFYIRDSTATQCARRQIAGKVPSSGFYFSGWCELDKSAEKLGVIAKYRNGLSKKECEAATPIIIPSGSCVNSSTLWGSTGDATFTRIVCAISPSSTTRFGFLQTLSSTIAPTVPTTVLPLSPLVFPQSPSNFFQMVGLRRSGKRISSSSSPFKVDTTIVGDPAPSDTRSVLFQVLDELFATSTEAGDPLTAALESRLTPSSLSSLTSTGLPPFDNFSLFTPSLKYPELPVGQVYNGFNTSNAAILSAAGKDATKYYSVRRTRADLGAYVVKSNVKEGQGFTISLFLRATRETQGFAFAVTDGVEDLHTGGSPILDLMMALMSSNADATSWFDMDYHIYSSLFVDGPGKQLVFITASPSQVLGAHKVSLSSNKTTGKSFQTLTWDLDLLGMQRVLNGMWHQLHFVVRLENNLLKVQLMVDGETSLSTFGWNQCLNADIEPIVDYPVGYQMFTFNKTQQVSPGGILWTGYLNGGVSSLEFSPTIPEMFTLWSTSSYAVREHNRLQELGYYLLGYILLGIGAVLMIFILVTSSREMYVESAKQDRSLTTKMYTRVVKLMMAVPQDPISGDHYKAVKYTTAKRWLGLADGQIGQFLDELQQSVADVPSELVRVLYLCGLALLHKKEKQSDTPMPTAPQWNQLLADDEEKYIKDHTRHFPCYKEGKPEEDAFATVNIQDVLDAAHEATLSRTMMRELMGGVMPKDELEAAEGGAQHPLVIPKASPEREGNADEPEAEDKDGSKKDKDASVNILAFQGLLRVAEKQDERAEEAGPVNTANLNTGGGGGNGGAEISMKGDGPSGSFNADDLKQLFFPIISVIQTVYLWISSSEFAKVYLEYFHAFFSFMSIDWVNSFELPTIVTPLVQLLVGLLAFLILLYLTAMDEIRFSWYVARYVLKRDHIELVHDAEAGDDLLNRTTRTEAKVQKNKNIIAKYTAKLTEKFPEPFGKFSPFPFVSDLEVLPVREAMKLDYFVGISDVDVLKKPEERGEAPSGDADEELKVLEIYDHRKRKFTLTKTDECKGKSDEELAAALAVTAEDPAAKIRPLELVGVFCRHHPHRRLSPQLQTDVWPFLFAPQCCVVLNGSRCNASQGQIYSCQENIPTEDGRNCLCDFAICERHYRGSIKDGIMADALAAIRRAQQNGTQWVIATIIMLVANAAYMPFVKTAIMILACHPLYQCEFTKCHDFTDQKYLISFFLALCVVVLFGFGLPAIQVLQLRRRRNLLSHAFFAEEYNGKYEEKEDDAEEDDVAQNLARTARRVDGGELTLDASISMNVRKKREKRLNTPAANKRSNRNGGELAVVDTPSPRRGETPIVEDVDNLGSVIKVDDSHVVPRLDDTEMSGDFTIPDGRIRDDDSAAESPRKLFGPDEIDDAHVALGSKSILLSEWNRFLASDPTVLGGLYKSLEFHWIYLSPIILLWKVVLICPAVFLPSSTFSQLVGISVTEVGFALFMFVTAPFISPMADLMYRVGSVHQILFLGFQALDTLERYRGNKGYATALVILTFSYLAFCVLCILWTIIGPQVRKAWNSKQSIKALEELGYQFTQATSLYLIPSKDAIRTRKSPYVTGDVNDTEEEVHIM